MRGMLSASVAGLGQKVPIQLRPVPSDRRSWLHWRLRGAAWSQRLGVNALLPSRPFVAGFASPRRLSGHLAAEAAEPPAPDRAPVSLVYLNLHAMKAVNETRSRLLEGHLVTRHLLVRSFLARWEVWHTEEPLNRAQFCRHRTQSLRCYPACPPKTMRRSGWGSMGNDCSNGEKVQFPARQNELVALSVVLTTDHQSALETGRPLTHPYGQTARRRDNPICVPKPQDATQVDVE